MSYVKKVMFKNSRGECLYFDNKQLYCESIDTTGTSATHITEKLAFTDGQTTITHNYGAKTIPASFAFADKNDDEWMRNRIVSIFTSLENGVLTVWSKTSKYEIDCYVQEIPVITKDSNVPYVYRWNVDFIADYPFWRKDKKHVVNYTNVLQSQNINYYGEIAAPWNLTYKATGNIFICNNGHSIKINAYNGYVNIDSYTTKVTNESGKNINYIIDPTTEFDYYNLVPGKNNFVISGADTAALSFYNLAIGVI